MMLNVVIMAFYSCPIVNMFRTVSGIALSMNYEGYCDCRLPRTLKSVQVR